MISLYFLGLFLVSVVYLGFSVMSVIFYTCLCLISIRLYTKYMKYMKIMEIRYMGPLDDVVFFQRGFTFSGLLGKKYSNLK